MGHSTIQTTMRYVHHRDRGGEAKLLIEAFAVTAVPDDEETASSEQWR